MDEFQAMAQSVVDLAMALGETPPQELLSVAQPERVAKSREAFPICSALEVIAKGQTQMLADMKAGKYPYPLPRGQKNPEEEDEDDEKEKAKAKKGTDAALIQAIKDLKTSVDKFAGGVQKADGTPADTQKQTEPKKDEDEEEDDDEKKKAKVKKAEGGDPDPVQAPPAAATPATPAVAPAAGPEGETKIAELIKAAVNAKVEATLRQSGFLESSAAILPVGDTGPRPGVLSKGDAQQTAEDIEKFTKLSFQEMNRFRAMTRGFAPQAKVGGM